MTQVLLIHGLGCRGAIWDPVRARLPRDLEVEAPTMMEGRSMEAEAADLVPLLREGDGAVVVGHSMGGLIATAVAEQAPERVGHLMLVNTPITYASRLTAHTGPEKLVSAPVIGGLLWRLANDERRRAGLTSAVAPGTPVPDELMEGIKGISHRAFVGATKSVDRYVLARPFRDRLAALGTPTTVVFGDVDRRVALDSLAHYDGLPNVTIERLGGVGHTPPLEAPEELANLIAYTTRGAR